MFPLFQVPYFNVSLKAVVFGISVLGSIYALSTIFIQIYEGGKGKNGSTVAVSYFYFQIFSLLTWAMKTTFKCKWNYILYERSYIFEVQRKMWRHSWLIIAVINRALNTHMSSHLSLQFKRSFIYSLAFFTVYSYIMNSW